MPITHDISSNGSSDAGISERQLILFSQQGDRAAFACLYNTYLERIHRYVFFRVLDVQVAEDLTSLVFLKALENLDTFQSGRSPFAAWLYRIAHNAIIDHYYKRKTVLSLEEVAAVQPLKLSYSDEADDKLDGKFRSHELYEALKELTRIQRDVLMFRFIFGLTILETALRLGRRQGSIRALQFRGLRRLAVILPARENFRRSNDLV